MYLFIGERPSERAVEIGATWQNGKLAGRTLHDALQACGIDPASHEFANLWRRPRPGHGDKSHERRTLRRIRQLLQQGAVVVGLGNIVCRTLSRKRIPHVSLVHPAARGSIRKKERYIAHVQQALGRKEASSEQRTRPLSVL